MSNEHNEPIFEYGFKDNLITLDSYQVETVLRLTIDQVSFLKGELALCRETLTECRRKLFDSEERVQDLIKFSDSQENEISRLYSLIDSFEEQEQEKEDWWQQEDDDNEYINSVTESSSC